MSDILERLGLKRRKSRRERLQEAVSEGLESVVEGSRRNAPKMTKAAARRAKKARERAGDAAETLRERAGDVAHSAADAGTEASEQLSALLAALGSKATDWEAVASSLLGDLQEGAADVGERAGEKVEGAKKAMKKRAKKRGRGYPAITTWLLRMGVGVWFVQSLRNKDLTAYIDYEAGEQMRAASEGHPVAWYKDLLDEFMIPNASLVAMGMVAGTALAAIGYITGINRRLAALLGILLSGNKMMVEYKDEELRGQNLVAMLAQLLLLRTGG